MRPDHPLTDPELDALLRALPREAPTTGFADRVMAQVRVPVAVPSRAGIPWRAVVGILTLDIAVATGLLAWFGDDLLRGLVSGVHGLAKAMVGLSTLDLATLQASLLEHLLGAGAWLPSLAGLSTVLLLGATGALLTIATLGRLTRGVALPSR